MFTIELEDELWERWARGESSRLIAQRLCSTPHAVRAVLVAQLVVTFAIGVIASALYVDSSRLRPYRLRGLVFVVSLIGLTLTCFVIRHER